MYGIKREIMHLHVKCALILVRMGFTLLTYMVIVYIVTKYSITLIDTIGS